MNPEQLDELGEFLIENIRDFNIDKFDELLDHRSTPLFGRKLGVRVREEFTQEQVAIFRKVIAYCIDMTIAELLYKLDKSNYESSISICIENQAVSEDGDSLRMELYSDEGWIARFSRHYEEGDDV